MIRNNQELSPAGAQRNAEKRINMDVQDVQDEKRVLFILCIHPLTDPQPMCSNMALMSPPILPERDAL